MRLLTRILLFLCVGGPPFLYSQTSTEVKKDPAELLKIWNTTSLNDTTRMNAFVDAITLYLRSDLDTTLILVKQLNAFASQKNNLIYQAKAKQLLSFYSDRSNQPADELKYLKEALTLYKKANYPAGTIVILNYIGMALTSVGDYSGATTYIDEAQKLSAEHNNKEGLFSSANNKGTIYHMLGQYVQAVEHYEKALGYSVELKNVNKQGRMLVNLGNIYNMQGDVEGALKYYRKGLVILQETKDKRNMSNAYNNIGTLYMDTKHQDSAEHYLLKGLKLRQEMNDRLLVATSLSNLGEVYMKQNKIAKATECYEKAIATSREIGATYGGIAGQLLHMSELALITKDISKAKKYAEEALASAEESGSLIDKVACYELCYRITRGASNFKDALIWHEKYMTAKDSLIGEENQKTLTEQRYRNEYTRKVVADSLRTQEEKHITALQMDQHRSQRNYLITGLLFFIAGSLFLLNRFTVTRKQKKIIEVQKKLVEQKAFEVEMRQKEILDSIEYAKRIQTALMSNEKYIDKTLKKLQK